MWDLLSSLSLSLQDLIVLAAIGNREAATYNTDLNARIGIFFMMIALSALLVMIGFRARQAQEENVPPYLIRTSPSNWIATRLFLIGWGVAVLSGFFIMAILPKVIAYYRQAIEYPSFHWCYECSGWAWTLGPELSAVVSGLSLAGLIIGLVMLIAKGRQTVNNEVR